MRHAAELEEMVLFEGESMMCAHCVGDTCFNDSCSGDNDGCGEECGPY